MDQVQVIGLCVRSVLADATVRKATKFLDRKRVVKVCRPAFKADKKRGRFLKTDEVGLVVTIGKPNYAEREILRKEQGTPIGVILRRL